MSICAANVEAISIHRLDNTDMIPAVEELSMKHKSLLKPAKFTSKAHSNQMPASKTLTALLCHEI